MAKVICKLPNASELISGVRFVSHELGVISEEVADEVAAAFQKIPGYVLSDKRGRPVGEPDMAGGATKPDPAAPSAPAT